MRQTDDGQDAHSSSEEPGEVGGTRAAACGACRLEREAGAEQHREVSKELALDQPVDAEEHRFSVRSPGHGAPSLRAEHVGAEEAHEIGEEDAAEGEASHGIEQVDAFVRRNRPGGRRREGERRALEHHGWPRTAGQHPVVGDRLVVGSDERAQKGSRRPGSGDEQIVVHAAGLFGMGLALIVAATVVLRRRQ